MDIMPKEKDKQVQAITASCQRQGKKKKDCERMAWAVVNSKKDKK